MQPATPPTERELQARNNLALSLINQRKPSLHVLEMVRLALLGATVQDLVDIERGAR